MIICIEFELRTLLTYMWCIAAIFLLWNNDMFLMQKCESYMQIADIGVQIILETL